jgi:anti-sigma regulatory factor (Ser/Thr protein kinase)
MERSEPYLGNGQTHSPSLRVCIPPNARYGKSARDEVIAFADRHKISICDLEDFIFALGEAIANAIEHSGSSEAIEIICRIEADKIVATVTDSGRGFVTDPLPKTPLPDEFAERGRGLPIMERCSDIFAVRSVLGKGTAVVLGRYLRVRKRVSDS